MKKAMRRKCGRNMGSKRREEQGKQTEGGTRVGNRGRNREANRRRNKGKKQTEEQGRQTEGRTKGETKGRTGEMFITAPFSRKKPHISLRVGMVYF
jgi:hypothetical protein